jgi:cohesin loading factor subunit SCC2
MTPTVDLTPGDRKVARKHLDVLNAEANNSRQTSQLLDQSIRQLQHLLRPAEVTQYKFQSLPFNSKSSSGSSSANSGTPTQLPNLSPFAKLVMDSTDVSYRYPTPTSPSNEPSRRPTKAQEVGGYSRQTARPKVQDKVEAGRSHLSNTVQKQLHVGQQSVAVVQPVVPQSPRLSDYRKLPEVDSHGAAENPNQTGKRNREAVDNQATLSLDIDQREQVNVALNAFSQALASTFEAEDDYETDSRCPSDYFLPDVTGSNNSPFLSKIAVNRLDSVIQKVTSVRGFAKVPLEDLSRLQKLLSHTVSSVDTFNLVLGQDNSESDVNEWLQRVDMAEIGLLAVRILLRIMTAGREEKQLYSEDYLNCILCALEHVIDTCIIPIVESRSSTDKDNFRTFSTQKKPLTSLLLMVGKVLRLFGNLIAKVDIADSAVAKVEYISTRLIFVENAPVEKESCLGIQRFEVLRRTAMDVLAQIFQRYPDQRTSIIDEILVSLEKLPVTRQSARQFKLPDGKPIQLVSALLMRLVQASAIMSLDSKSQRREDQLGDDDDADMSDEEAPHPQRRMSTVSAEDGEQSDESNQNIRKLRERVTPLYDSASKNASYMIQFLVQRALKSTKTGDTPYRNLLDIFTEDFLNVLGMPEWPAAEMLLRALLSKMISITNDEKSSVPSKNVALDLLGLMGSGISDLLLLLQNSSKSLDASQSNLANRLTLLLNSEDGINDSELIHFRGPYRIVIEYLIPQCAKDPHIYSAVAFLVTQWARTTLALADSDGSFPVSKELLQGLRKVLTDYDWLRSE